MKIKNRYIILAIATLVNFVHGNPYIWTVFQPYVQSEYGLTLAQSSQPFTIIIAVFAIGNMLGGFLEHRIGPRMTILAGSFVMCGGFFLAAVAPQNMAWLVSAGYGLLGGIGSGCAFAVLTAVPLAWFPDRRGLVSGITIGIVGISGVIMNPFCDYMLEQYGYRFAMIVVTVIYAVLSLGGLFITRPDGDTSDCSEDIYESDAYQYTTKEMLKTKCYLLISISMALAVPAYVLVNPLMKTLGMERGLTSDAALAGVLAASVFNIFGRFAAPWISDKIGRKIVIQGLYVITMVSVIGLFVAEGMLFVLLASLISLSYGGFVSVYPVFTSDCFGLKYQSMNYGAVMIGYGIISVLCPYLLEAATNSPMGINLSFIIAGVVCAAGMLVTAVIKPPQHNLRKK